MLAQIPTILPPLRRKIRKSFFVVISLYALLGIFMIFCVFLASGVTPKLIHVNYDSISAALEMRKSWYALKHKEVYPEKSTIESVGQFEKSLQFAEGNVTEPGEKETLSNIRAIWDKFKTSPGELTGQDHKYLLEYFDRLVSANEKGMFRLAKESTSFRHKVLLVSILFFLLTLVLTLLLADGLANRLAKPIKEIAEVLRSDPNLEHRLKLPLASSLEIRILSTEINSLWERLGRFHKLNIEELASERERLETVLTSIEDAVLVLDNEELVLQVSDGMLRIIGIKDNEIIGQRWSDISTNKENYLKLRERLKNDLVEDNVVELNIDGNKRIFAARSREIITKSIQKIGRIYLLHDITEARHRERLKAEFIGVLSHELKTPIQSLVTAAELLESRKGKLDDETKMLTETISEDVSRIRAVANDFMQVSVVDLRSLKLKMEKVPLSQHLQEWIKPFRILARDKNVQIEFVSEGSDVIWANVDVVKFPWAISNLLANAIRVSPNASKVTVLITNRSNTPGMAEIEIRDDGPGIQENVRGKMFEPYYQATPIGGSSGFLGLGLTIAKEVVEAHDGIIEYFPRHPHGSAFRISIPSVLVYG